MFATHARTAFVLLVSLPIAGCTIDGARAETGACPFGETCSSQSPNGLEFIGASFSDAIAAPDGLPPVAAGGIETVTTLIDGATGVQDFTKSFVATSDDSNVLTAGAATPPTFQMLGHAPGTSLVKLRDPATDQLLDEVDARAEAVATATVVPQDLAVRELFVPRSASESWVLLAGGEVTPLVVRLEGPSKDRMVDETMSLTPMFGPAAKKAWDLFDVTPPASAGEASFSIVAGGASFQAKVPVVASVDDVMPVQALPSTALTTTESSMFCVLGTSGGAPVAGVRWTFTPSAGLSVMPEGLSTLVNCVILHGTVAGPAKLTVSASGFTKVFDLTVSAAKTRHAPHRAWQRTAAQPVPGDRAAASGGR